MTILEHLYYGNINPSEKYIKNGSDYQKINKSIMEDINKLIPLLNEQEKQLYKKIEDNISRLSCIAEKECFIEGFRIGSQMVWEIMNFKSENYI